MKEIKDMIDKELVEELEGIENHIELFTYGRYELVYREALYREISKRGLEVTRTSSFKLNK